MLLDQIYASTRLGDSCREPEAELVAFQAITTLQLMVFILQHQLTNSLVVLIDFYAAGPVRHFPSLAFDVQDDVLIDMKDANPQANMLSRASSRPYCNTPAPYHSMPHVPITVHRPLASKAKELSRMYRHAPPPSPVSPPPATTCIIHPRADEVSQMAADSRASTSWESKWSIRSHISRVVSAPTQRRGRCGID